MDLEIGRDNPFDSFPTLADAARAMNKWRGGLFLINDEGIVSPNILHPAKTKWNPNTLKMEVTDEIDYTVEPSTISPPRSDRDQLKLWLLWKYVDLVKDWRKEYEEKIMKGVKYGEVLNELVIYHSIQVRDIGDLVEAMKLFDKKKFDDPPTIVGTIDEINLHNRSITDLKIGKKDVAKKS